MMTLDLKKSPGGTYHFSPALLGLKKGVRSLLRTYYEIPRHDSQLTNLCFIEEYIAGRDR